jgi:hypothetical protein
VVRQKYRRFLFHHYRVGVCLLWGVKYFGLMLFMIPGGVFVHNGGTSSNRIFLQQSYHFDHTNGHPPLIFCKFILFLISTQIIESSWING